VAGDDFATKSATELAAAIRTKQISSRELLDLYLDRIDRLNPEINAVVTLDVERARAAAAAADQRIAGDEFVGPLHGLPITIKDAIEVAGLRSTGGATELTDHVPAVDAPAVAALKAAGAIVFGKTNLPRWSGDLQSYNEIFGTTNNPWDHTCGPGGSSGGAAAAVACGLTSFELGTDIGGSVRIPSHFCGVFGLKPSYGVIPQRGYLDRVNGGITDADINVFGPIARSADDLALLLGVMAGAEPERAIAWRLELPAPARETLAGARIAVHFEDPACAIDSEYLSILRRMADHLADAGAKVEEATLPVPIEEQRNMFNALIVGAIAPSMPDEVADTMAGSHLAWLRLQDERARMAAKWASWFAGRGIDALLCPVTPTAAFPHNQDGDFLSRTIKVNDEDRSYLENTFWTGLIGVIGLPSAVPPLQHTSAGRPVGVQVVTPYLHDRSAVALGELIAEVAGGGYQIPPMAR
jgi:amidase